jgi:hypothetical protein
VDLVVTVFSGLRQRVIDNVTETRVADIMKKCCHLLLDACTDFAYKQKCTDRVFEAGDFRAKAEERCYPMLTDTFEPRQLGALEEFYQHRLGDGMLSIKLISDNDFVFVDRLDGLENTSSYL